MPQEFDVLSVPANMVRALAMTPGQIAEEFGARPGFTPGDDSGLRLVLVDDVTRSVWVMQGDRREMLDLGARINQAARVAS